VPVWKRTIDLRPAVAIYHERGDIPATAAKAVEIVEASGWLDETPYPDTLRDHLGRLKNAEDAYDYTVAFDPIYDVADEDRIWIETT
jgi:hypothetical protein